MTADDALTGTLDISKPQSARRYDYWLEGKDNFAGDRASGDAIAKDYSGVKRDARANRAWMNRVVRTLADSCSVRQFLDLGVGYPFTPNVHEIAQRVDPTCKVVYVDHDPLVIMHARALLASNDSGATAHALLDIADPDAVLEAARKTLDFGQPVAVLAIAVLHYLTDDQQAYDIIGRLTAALPDGSYLAASHFTLDDIDEPTAAKIEKRIVSGADGPFRPRTKAQFSRFFADRQLLDPGICTVDQWRPDWWEPAEEEKAALYAAVARIERAGEP